MKVNREMADSKLKVLFAKFGDQKNQALHEAGYDEDLFEKA